MNTRVVRKAIGLLIVDIVIIIGIFILQFRTDSSILKKFGDFQITMAKSETEDSEYELQNKLEISYNGLNIHSNDQDGIKILKKDQPVPEVIRLIEFIEDEQQYTFNFTNDVSLIFILGHDATDAPLTIYVDVPKEITDIFVPFSFAYNMKIQKDEGNRIVLQGKKQTWTLHSDSISSNYIHFTYADNLAHYSVYDDTKKFTFDSIIQLAAAEKATYDKTIDSFISNLYSAFKSSLSDSSFTEQAVVAYIAAMSKDGKYQQAIDDIPADYKKSDSRTYLSAPFLNSLANMNKKLDTDLEEINRQIKKAADEGSFGIFTIPNIAAKLCIYPDLETVSKILRNAAQANVANLTIEQINGLLTTYSDFAKLHRDYAAILEPLMDPCIEKLTEACSYDNDILTISENDTFLSVVQASQTGIALLRYGQTIGNDTFVKAGRVIVNSYISESSSFDLRTLSTLYPLLEYDNKYYPHFELINSYGKTAVWAWTCAQNIYYSKDSEGALNLAIDFPLGLTHYVIFKGIPSFEQIFIYDMAFRTDPRFETYNSSGYVYRSDSNTLLLKSRHKSTIENVRMTYTPVKKAAPAPKPAETTASGTEETGTSSTAGAETSLSTESPSTGSGTTNSSGTTNTSGTTSNPETTNSSGTSSNTATSTETSTSYTTTE